MRVEWNRHYFFIFHLSYFCLFLFCLFVLPYYVVNKDEYLKNKKVAVFWEQRFRHYISLITRIRQLKQHKQPRFNRHLQTLASFIILVMFMRIQRYHSVTNASLIIVDFFISEASYWTSCLIKHYKHTSKNYAEQNQIIMFKLQANQSSSRSSDWLHTSTPLHCSALNAHPIHCTIRDFTFILTKYGVIA